MDKHLKKRSVFVTLLAVAVLFGCIFTGGSVYGKTQSDSRSAMEQTATADPSTIESWTEIAEDTTKYIGRIWTDKTVNSEEINLPESGAGKSFSIKKGQASDFIIGLSALSSASNIKTMTDKPLDIVMVLDTSSSMSREMPGNYTEVFKNNVDETSRGPVYYAEVNGQYIKIQRVTTGFIWERFDHWELNGQTVYPRENAQDSQDGHIAFYKAEKMTRLDSLKQAAAGFVEQTTEQNASLSQDKQHRISIVNFSDEGKVVKELTLCNAETAGGIKTSINRLRASGNTYPGKAMAAAEESLKRARAGAQKIIIFFTDGNPAPAGTDKFDEGLANAGVTAAKSLKNKGTVMYSIGVFEGADPSNESTAETNKFNAYMHAMSSNYPGAEAWNRLGERDADGNYYKAAADADELNRIFTEIFDEISHSTGFPTEVESGNPANDGYITITDRLGDYMQVDQFHTIVYADQLYKTVTKSTQGNTDTYTFEGSNVGNALYPQGNLSSIVMTVTKSDSVSVGDTVQVKIPAGLIPLRHFNVESSDGENYQTTVTNAFPMRIFYDVSLKEAAKEKIKAPDESMQTYINENKSDGKVSFYSNAFTPGAVLGDTKSVFTPSKNNHFYYFTENAVLYTDADCTQPLKQPPSDTGSYYYQRTYYDVNKTTPQKEIVKLDHLGKEKLADVVQTDSEDRYYIPAGLPRLTTVADTGLKKSRNLTGTAKHVINPDWDHENVREAKSIIVSLGNNGKLEVELPAELTVTKKVTAETGITAPDKEFCFKLSLTNEDGTGSTKSFSAQKYEADGSASGSAVTVTDKSEFNLKNGQSLKVTGLDAGLTYQVTEINLPAGFTQTAPAGSDGKAGTAGGTVQAGEEQTAVFTNHYAIGEKQVSLVDLGLKGTKTLLGRSFNTADQFSFKLQPLDAQEQPEGEPLTAEVNGASWTGKNQAAISFGDDAVFTFDRPGHYSYMVYEDVPSSPAPGITYDTAKYILSFNLQDNKAGELEIKNLLIREETGEETWQTVYESEDGDYPPTDKEYFTFTNTYSATTGTFDTTGLFTKVLTGRDWGKEDTFQFEIQGAENAPMPEQRNVTVQKPEAGNRASFGFGTITFEQPGTYIYHIKEERAGTVVDGLAYAENTATLTITVSDNGGTLTAVPEVSNGEFVNTYSESLNYGEIGGIILTKKLEGTAMKEKEFTLLIKALDSSSAEKLNLPKDEAKVVQTKAAGAGEEIVATALQDLVFDAADAGQTYSFTAEELLMSRPGYQYDKTKYTVTIAVTKQEAGKLQAVTRVAAQKGETETQQSYQWESGDTKKDPIRLAFVNTYTASSNPVTVEAEKILHGKTLRDGEFTFVIADSKGTPVTSGTNKADGTIRFEKELSYEIEDLNRMTAQQTASFDGDKTYTIPYTVKEDTANLPAGVTASKANYSFNVKVENKGDGTLEAVAEYPQGGLQFVNQHAMLEDTVSLTINGRKVVKADAGQTPPDITGKYTFRIESVNGAPLPVKKETVNDRQGNISFGAVTFRSSMLDDVKAAQDGSRTKEFRYRVTESGNMPGISNDTAKTFSVTLKDDGKGNLSAIAGADANFCFENTYQTAPQSSSITDELSINKQLEGRTLKEGEFLFELRNAQGEVVSTGKNDSKGKIVFKPVTYTKAGVYDYTVYEKNLGAQGIRYDSSCYGIRTTVKDASDGTLKVSHKTEEQGAIVFRNYYKPQPATAVIGAFKKLEGGELKEGAFTFELKNEEGKVIARAVNAKDGQIAFSPITYQKAGTYRYTISEVQGDREGIRYDSKVYRTVAVVKDNGKGALTVRQEREEENGAIFVNRCTKQEAAPAQTGDDRMLGGLFALTAAAAVALAGSLLLTRRKREK